MSRQQLDLAVQAATAAGKILRKGFRRLVAVLDEQDRDIKIASDHEAEKVILECLGKWSHIPVLTEESGMLGARVGERAMWVVDPLDGTLNYSRGLPLCCVSIALWQDHQPVLGVVYEFLHDRLYTGIVGEGAWCDDKPIRVSEVSDPTRAVIATGFPASADFSDTALTDFVRRVQQFKKVRLLGTAALSLAQVAAGAADVYAENGICFWDVAAGLALVRAAGGDFTASVPTPHWRHDVIASNGRLVMP